MRNYCARLGNCEESVDLIEIDRERFPIVERDARSVVVPPEQRLGRTRLRVVEHSDVAKRTNRPTGCGKHQIRENGLVHTSGLRAARRRDVATR